MKIHKIGVAGCGLMGGGIVQTCAQSNYQVVVLEANDAFLSKGLDAIKKNLSRSVDKGKLQQTEMDVILGRIQGTTTSKDLSECDLIIEAIIEDFELKKELFCDLDSLCPEHTIFASNTSSIPIIEMASTTNRADRFVGLHFFNPVPVMKLVEVISTLKSSRQTVQKATEFAQSLNKTAIQAKDRAGFIVNLLLVPYLLDAVRALEMGLATKEDIDTGMVLGCGYPMGPLTLLDLVGLDTIYSITKILFDEFKDPKYASPPLLKQMVKAGLYGKKSGRGFYDYSTK